MKMDHNKKTYDIVVIGAGIAGLSAAYHLLLDGYSVAVFEKGTGTESASFASTAEMNHDADIDWEYVLKKFGQAGARDIWNLSEEAIKRLEAFAHRKGEVHFETRRVPGHVVSTSERGREMLRKKYELYKKIGANVTFTEDARALHPNFYSALTIADEGQSNNQALLKALKRGVRANGGSITYSAPVSKIATQKSAAQVYLENGNVIPCKEVIVATGGLDLLPEYAKHVGRIRTFVVSYKKRNMQKLFRSSVLSDIERPYHYIRSFGGNRLWVGGEDVQEAQYQKNKNKEETYHTSLHTFSRTVLGMDASYAREGGWQTNFSCSWFWRNRVCYEFYVRLPACRMAQRKR
jgi:glycine/D-amino acid oxidase-like deaminating enzyme